MKRRDFFKKALLGLSALTVAPTVLAEACKAGAAPAGKKVAKNKERLDYVLNAADAKDHKKYKKHAADNPNCGNCKFYEPNKKGKANKEIDGYGRCAMMANKYVSKCGWCKSWRKNS